MDFFFLLTGINCNAFDILVKENAMKANVFIS